MAEVTKAAAGASLGTKTPPASCRLSGDLYAGELLYQGDNCYIKSDGGVWRTTGAAAGAAAKSHGITNQKYRVGEAVTLFRNVNFGYSDGNLTPGQPLYASAVTAGALSTTPTVGGVHPVAFAVDEYRIHYIGDLSPASGVINGSQLANVADANVVGGVPQIFRIDVADATGDTDVVMTNKIRVIDAWGLNTGIAAHASTDTWQVKNGANAISDAVAKTATVNALKRIATINPTYQDIAAGGTLRITAAKTTNAAVTVYVLAIPVA